MFSAASRAFATATAISPNIPMPLTKARRPRKLPATANSASTVASECAKRRCRSVHPTFTQWSVPVAINPVRMPPSLTIA